MSDGPSSLRTVVNVVQLIAIAAAVAFVVLLFVNEPPGSAEPSGSTGPADEHIVWIRPIRA